MNKSLLFVVALTGLFGLNAKMNVATTKTVEDYSELSDCIEPIAWTALGAGLMFLQSDSLLKVIGLYSFWKNLSEARHAFILYKKKKEIKASLRNVG